jgi:hypothetical protein
MRADVSEVGDVRRDRYPRALNVILLTIRDELCVVTDALVIPGWQSLCGGLATEASVPPFATGRYSAAGLWLDIDDGFFSLTHTARERIEQLWC